MTAEPAAEGASFLRLRRQDDLLWATLSDPRRANALSPRAVAELTELYRRPLLDQGIRALLLTGEGRHFSAGADQHRQEAEALRGLFESVLRQECLTLALVQGACVAGGCGLATAHDFVVAADDARFLYSEVRIGFVAALVATYLPLRLKGADIRELLLNPEFIGAERALEIGLVNRVVPGSELLDAGERLAVEVLTRASSSSIALTKRLLLEALGRPLSDALERAAEINAAARATPDCKHGISTFLETKKPPDWR